MRKYLEYLVGLSPKAKGCLMFIVALAMTLPWLGLTDFNTKGEPREAVVSMSMLQQDNWVLPVNNEIDIPYKPMMFHWAGAVAALANGGETNEFTARFPSALALSLLIGVICWFYTVNSGKNISPLLAAAITLTCFEMHRAGVSARVDMMLTFWMVSAFFLLYRWWCRENSGQGRRFLYRIPWLAILCMSCAVLSKGPVGILLPCLATGIFMLLKRENFLKTFGWLTLFGLLALVLPLWWYWEAYQIGGKDFMELVMEENFGRLTGTMTYESHSNPWHYNFWITAVGLMPWTLLALFAGVGLLLKSVRLNLACRISLKWKGSDVGLFSLISLATVILFFCLPASKRSVYLMPAYPFIAWFMAEWFVWLAKKGCGKAIRIYGTLLAAVTVAVEILFLCVQFMPFGIGVFDVLEGLGAAGFLGWMATGILFGTGLVWFCWRGKLKEPLKMLGWECVMLFTLFVCLDACIQPAVLNAKSLKAEAGEIRGLIGEKPLYEYIAFGEQATANKYHFFELNYYLGDRMKNFVRNKPSTGYLAIEPGDAAWFLPGMEQQGYSFSPVYKIDRKARKEKIAIYKFEREAIPTEKRSLHER